MFSISTIFTGWRIENFLSLFGLVMVSLCILYLFYEWLKHRKKSTYLLLWSVSLALFYIFQIPTIQINLGTPIVLADLTNFFISTIPLIFLGWILVYLGIIQIKSLSSEKISARFLIFLLSWVLVSFIFYFFRFSSMEFEKLLSIIGIFIFFIAIHILILSSLWRWFRSEKNMRTNIGIIFIVSAIIVSIARYLIIVSRLTQYSAALWFLSIASFDIVFILRNVVVILLTVGFFLAHKHYLLKSG